MMPRYDYDLITIGAGSGGVRASRMAGKYGAKVAVIETSSIESAITSRLINDAFIPSVPIDMPSDTALVATGSKSRV